VDRYADVLVVEYFAAGMWKFRDAIQAALLAHFPGARIYRFAETHVQKQESFDCRAEEAPAPVEEAATAEPELIRKPKGEEEEEGGETEAKG
jgi:23S rRNA G2069 N7-methylase RlmK/C1962 C5-methylase RlmI